MFDAEFLSWSTPPTKLNSVFCCSVTIFDFRISLRLDLKLALERGYPCVGATAAVRGLRHCPSGYFSLNRFTTSGSTRFTPRSWLPSVIL